MSCYNRFIEPKEELWKRLAYGQLVGNRGNNLHLFLVSEVEGGLVGLSSLPVESDSISR